MTTFKDRFYDTRMKLRRAGIIVTKERRLVLTILQGQKKPITSAQILTKTKKKADPATVYRTIALLKKYGLIRQIDFGDTPRFELKLDDDHHHIVCTDCGKINDLDSCFAEKVITQLPLPQTDFKKITGHSFELFGLCNTCAK